MPGGAIASCSSCMLNKNNDDDMESLKAARKESTTQPSIRKGSGHHIRADPLSGSQMGKEAPKVPNLHADSITSVATNKQEMEQIVTQPDRDIQVDGSISINELDDINIAMKSASAVPPQVQS